MNKKIAILYFTTSGIPTTDRYHVYDGFQPPLHLTIPIPPAQAAASQLSTCRPTASHTLVLHDRHAAITTLPNSYATCAYPIGALKCSPLKIFAPKTIPGMPWKYPENLEVIVAVVPEL